MPDDVVAVVAAAASSFCSARHASSSLMRRLAAPAPEVREEDIRRRGREAERGGRDLAVML